MSHLHKFDRNPIESYNYQRLYIDSPMSQYNSPTKQSTQERRKRLFDLYSAEEGDDFYGYRDPIPDKVRASCPPITMQVNDQQVFDLGPEAQFPTYHGWDPAYHTSGIDPDENPWANQDQSVDTRATAVIFGTTLKNRTVTVCVRNIEWPVIFRLHDTDGTDFGKSKVKELLTLLQKHTQCPNLTIEPKYAYQTSGFVHDPALACPDGRPVRRKLLFGTVMINSVRAFNACKRFVNRCVAQNRYSNLVRAEELKIGDVTNKMNDRYGFHTSAWIRLDQYEYGDVTTHDDLHIWTVPSSIKTLDVNRTAPIRVVSVDIEATTPRKDHRGNHRFPDASEPDDRVIQIGMYFSVLGDTIDDEDRTLRIILCLGETEAPEGVIVRSFGSMERGITDEDEADMLAAYARLLCVSNVRCIIGYNLNGFDYPYLITRAELLEEHSFWYMSPMIATRTNKREYMNRRGRSLTNLAIPGTFTIDMLEQVQELPGEMKSYKLDDVAEKFLGRKKVEMGYNHMMDMWLQTAADRGQIAHYCIIDCELPFLLCHHLNVLTMMISYSNITYNTIAQLLGRGVTAVLSTYVARVAHKYGYVYATRLLDGTRMAESSDTSYGGGWVLDPQMGAWDWVSCLDFASLYPSIIRTFNLDYGTLVHYSAEQVRQLRRKCPGADLQTYKTDVGDFSFLANAHDDNGGRGLLPLALGSILDERAAARALAKQSSTTPQEASNLEIKQKKLKVLANSIYGLLGGKTDTACVGIAATITERGRTLLGAVKDAVELATTPTGEKMYDVLYGDTDSVFVRKKDGVDLGISNSAGMDMLVEKVNEWLCDRFCNRGFSGAAGLAYEVLGQSPPAALPTTSSRAHAKTSASEADDSVDLEQCRQIWNEANQSNHIIIDGNVEHGTNYSDDANSMVDEDQRQNKIYSAAMQIVNSPRCRRAYDMAMAATEIARSNWVVELENEEEFSVIWFFKKKQYIARRTDGSKMEKGIAIKRSDMCTWAASTVREVVYKALDDSTTIPGNDAANGALDLLECSLRQVIRDGPTYEMVTISNKLSAPPVDCDRADVKQPHALVAYDLEARTGVRVAPGDRVPFVYTLVTDNPKLVSRCAQCPDFAQRNHFPIDLVYYLRAQVMVPLQRFLKHFGVTCVQDRMMPFIKVVEKTQRDQLERNNRAKRVSALGMSTASSVYRDTMRLDAPWDPKIVKMRPILPSKQPEPNKSNVTVNSSAKRTIIDMFAKSIDIKKQRI